MQTEVHWLSMNPWICRERGRARISDPWPHAPFSLHSLRTDTALPKSGSMMALHILVMRIALSVHVGCFAAGWRAQSYTEQNPHISLEVNDIDIFCLIWRCFIRKHSKSDLVSFSISLIILTLAGACVVPEKQREEEELDSEIRVWYMMKDPIVQLLVCLVFFT